MSVYKEICIKFITYLLEEGEIANNKVEKQHARKIYMDTFKPKHQIVRCPFSTLCRHLKGFQFIIRDKNNLIFHPGVLNKCSGHKSFSEKPNVAASISNNSEQTPVSDVAKKCMICRLTFGTETKYKQHLTTIVHSILSRYVTNRTTLINPIAGLCMEVEDNHGPLAETLLLRANVPKEFLLHIINTSGIDYYLTEIIELSPKTSITLQQLAVPYLLRNQVSLILKLQTKFTYAEYAAYPIVISLKHAESGSIIHVLKELIFHAHSDVLDDMHAKEPYTKPKAAPVYEICGIVRGEHMKRGSGDFKPAIILQQYILSDALIIILNHGINDFDGMNRHQACMMRDMRSLLHNFKFKHGGKLNEQNYYEMLRLLLFLEEYQMKIDIKKYSIDDCTLHTVKGVGKNCLELKIHALAEQRPSILRGDSIFVKETPTSALKYEGIVHRVKEESVILGFSHKFINKVHIANKKYHVMFGFNRVSIRAEHQAINLMNEHRAITLLCKDSVQTGELKNHQLTWFNPNIANNSQQQQAVRHILSQTSRPMPYLVFGPPGTGKTVTIVEAVLQVWKMLPTKNILVCAPTNNAADEVTKRLVEIVPKRDLIRYVAPSYPYDFIYEKVKPYVNYADGDYYHPPNSTILRFRIVVTTLVTASRLVNGGTPRNHFEYVFIDESGQATEPESLIPIAGLLTSLKTLGAINGQVVLAGDPKQLGPIVHSKQATLYGFATSMLERLMTDTKIYKKNDQKKYNNYVLTKLVQSYRSHPAILYIPNKLFYDGELTPCAETTITHMAEGWEFLPNPKFPVLFYNVIGKDEREKDSPSFFNVQEIDVVLNCLSQLIGTKLSGIKISGHHIGIIAPYRKQVCKLQRACAKYGDDILIGSVEQFQGQERHIIILTTVRSDPGYINYDVKYNLGFLKNPKRFNVAITRSKALLIVIGNANILQLDPNWNALIKYCMDNNSAKGPKFNFTPTNVSDLTVALDSLQIGDCAFVNDPQDGPSFARGRV